MIPNSLGLYPSDMNEIVRGTLQLCRNLYKTQLQCGTFVLYRDYDGIGLSEIMFRVYRTDRRMLTFEYSMQDAVERLTGTRFDGGTNAYVMLDYLEDRGVTMA